MATFPRFGSAVCSSALALVFGWAATTLPWRDWTLFSSATAAVAAMHAVTAALLVAGHRSSRPAWRFQSFAALGYLAYLTWGLGTSMLYLSSLYGGLGQGVAVALGLVWLIAVALTLPTSLWGLRVTGGLRWTPRRRGAAVVVVALVGLGLVRSAKAAIASPTAAARIGRETIEERLAPLGSDERRLRGAELPSLMTVDAVACPEPASGASFVVVATYVGPVGTDRRPVARSICLSNPSFDDVVAELRLRLRQEAFAGPVKIDVVTATSRLRPQNAILDPLSLRPGLDGVCEGDRCLMPWQLLALDVFRDRGPISFVPEFRFGFVPGAIRQALRGTPGSPVSNSIEGLTRIETHSVVIDGDGELHRLRRLRPSGPDLTERSLRRALTRARDHIAHAQLEDGRFRYQVDPLTGQTFLYGFSLPRQAGTTLAWCELAGDHPRAREVASAALDMMATTARHHGALAALRYPAGRKAARAYLGSTALATAAFAACRDLVGPRHDELVAAMTAFLLEMQTDEGSFHPEFDLDAGRPVPGPDRLYGVGQAVLALTMIEGAVTRGAPLGDLDTIHEAVQRAMDYTSGPYWSSTFVADFFFLEENWHCLAARAALSHHRDPNYERFCLDYVRYRSRLILDPASRVDPDLVGGYGFGNVLLPHNTASAGFGETAAAALSIAAARGEDSEALRARLGYVLRFLLHQQWSPSACFACARDLAIPGAFSEHMGTTEIRIDYVQHAMAALGHGGRALGLLASPPPVTP